MKHDYTSVQNVYIICGKTDMRKGIDGLATLIQDSFELDPFKLGRNSKSERHRFLSIFGQATNSAAKFTDSSAT